MTGWYGENRGARSEEGMGVSHLHHLWIDRDRISQSGGTPGRELSGDKTGIARLIHRGVSVMLARLIGEQAFALVQNYTTGPEARHGLAIGHRS